MKPPSGLISDNRAWHLPVFAAGWKLHHTQRFLIWWYVKNLHTNEGTKAFLFYSHAPGSRPWPPFPIRIRIQNSQINADPCRSWIYNTGENQCCGSGMFIPHPSRIPDPVSATKNLSILTQKIVSTLSEIWSELFIPDPDPVDPSRIPDPGSRGQKAPDPGSSILVITVLTSWCRGMRRTLAPARCRSPQPPRLPASDL